jgi:hypothetical protein
MKFRFSVTDSIAYWSDVDNDDSGELCYDDAWTVMMLVQLDL